MICFSNLLQVHNEQINDLLEPSQRDLQVHYSTRKYPEIVVAIGLCRYLIQLHSFFR